MNAPFRISTIPPVETIFSHIQKNTPYEMACASVKPELRNTDKIELSLVDINVEAMRNCVLRIIDQYGYSGWRHHDGESKTYGGFSLTYNPDHQEGANPHISSIGTPKNLKSEFFWSATGNHQELKHSYFDTYGFRVRTPASRIGVLGDFIDSFERPLVRSRVGIIPGKNIDPNDAEYREKDGWHRDEPVFENLRINIPLQTDDSYLFQMENQAPYHLNVGTAYTWDTHRPHRVFASKPSTTMRIHLVLGVSPWFDYDPGEDSWTANQYFGRMHPFDMLAEGLVSKHLRFLS